MTRPAKQKRAATPAPQPQLPAQASARPFVLAVAAIAIALRLVHIWQIRSAPFFTVLMGDASAYDTWAQQIAGGDIIGRDVFYQAPLYPYFLGLVYALFGHSLLAVRVIQAVLGATASVLVGLTAWRLFGRTAGWIAGLGLAIYAPAIFFDGLVQKTVLDVFFIALSLWLVTRLACGRGGLWAWAALGVTMGALSLTRENALALVAVVALWSLIRTGTPIDCVRTAAAFLLAVAVVLVPVAVRNYAVGGGFYLTTSQFGPNLYIGNNPRADGTYASLRFGRGAPEYERQDATELAELSAGRALSPAEVSSYWTDRALDFIVSQPGRWLRLMARKFLLLSNATEMLDTESQDTYAEWSLPLQLTGWFTHFGVLVPLALFGLIATWSDQRLLIVRLLTATYAASVLVFYVFARYRFPLVPPLIVFAAAGTSMAPVWWRTHATSRRAAVAALLAAVVVFANWPVLSSALMRAITETNLGTALQAEGRLDDAVAHYRRALELQPDHAPALNNLGTALRAQGRVDDAIATYEQALELAADYPDAHYNLANALLEKNDPDAAAGHFAIALKSIPDSAGTRNNLGIALMGQGKIAEAIQQFEGALRLEPTSTKTLRNLASALDDENRSAEALTYLQRAVELDPNDADALYDLGSLQLRSGEFDKAVATLQKAVAANPKSVEARNNLGIALASEGRVSEAIAQFKEALTLDPHSSEARRNLELALGATRAQR